MKKIFKSLFIVILSILLIGMITGFIDYFRMTNGKVPIFNISSYDSSHKKQFYQGMLYTASRKVRGSDKEDLSDSTNLKFKLFYSVNLFIPEQKKVENVEYSFILKNSDKCSSILYYADLKTKIYTYCFYNFVC